MYIVLICYTPLSGGRCLCLYVCIPVTSNHNLYYIGKTTSRSHGRMYITDACMYVCAYACMRVCVYVCMRACVYVYPPSYKQIKQSPVVDVSPVTSGVSDVVLSDTVNVVSEVLPTIVLPCEVLSATLLPAEVLPTVELPDMSAVVLWGTAVVSDVSSVIVFPIVVLPYAVLSATLLAAEVLPTVELPDMSAVVLWDTAVV